MAASRDYLDILTYLLDSKQIPIDIENGSGATPLILASRAGCLQCVKLLLQRGAKIDHENFNGDTALMLAASGGKSEVLKVLLQNGASVEKQDSVSLLLSMCFPSTSDLFTFVFTLDW